MNKVYATGEVVVINGAAGIKLDTGVIWYPDQDLEDMEGETVRVTIDRLKPRGCRVIGFQVPPVKTKRRRRKR